MVPCLGFFDFRDGFSMSRDDLIAVEFPIPRVISKDCLFSYALSEGDGGDSSPTVPELLGIGLCSMCLGVSKAAAKQEPSSDGEVEDEDIAAAEEFMQVRLISPSRTTTSKTLINHITSLYADDGR